MDSVRFHRPPSPPLSRRGLSGSKRRTDRVVRVASARGRLVDSFIMATDSVITEADILADVVAAGEGDLAPEVARSILRWKLKPCQHFWP